MKGWLAYLNNRYPSLNYPGHTLVNQEFTSESLPFKHNDQKCVSHGTIHDKAADYVERAVKNDPTAAKYFRLLAAVYGKLGMAKEAKETSIQGRHTLFAAALSNQLNQWILLLIWFNQ